MSLSKMNTFVIGTEIISDLRDPGWENIVLADATWENVMTYVKDHTAKLTNSLVIVHIGPRRFTRFHRTSRRKELVLLLRKNLGDVNEIFQRWRDDLMPRLNIIPVICPVYPVNFHRFNRYLRESATFNNRLLLQDFYNDYNRDVLTMVQMENRVITAFNESNSVATPFMNRKVFSLNKGRYTFKDWLLTNGYDPISLLVAEWLKQIREAQSRNYSRFPFRADVVVAEAPRPLAPME